MHVADWLPTLARLTGANVPADAKLDGLDRWAVLTGTDTSPAPRTIYIPHYQRSAVFHGDWKLIASPANPAGKAELFNLAQDPYEQDECSARFPEKLKEMRERFVELRKGDLLEAPADAKFNEKPAK
jgi:arylsulfatase A-like enzyme